MKIDIDFDTNHLWHPYTGLPSSTPTYAVKSAKGACIILEDGTSLIDGMASWWCVIHGYNHPMLNNSIIKQLENMSHVMFGGLTHQPAINLGKELLELLPDSLSKIFYSDSGSVAVEVAMKMARQYWYAQGQVRTTFLTIKNGYHGDTFQPMSVCDPENGMHHIYHNVLPKNIFCSQPSCSFNDLWEDSYFNEMENLILSNKKQLAAVILEPIVQGAGGMWFYHPQYLKKLREICSQENILLIFDEIATGFGRTGKMFAMEHADVIPDIICLGKALTGGYLSFACTVTNSKIAEILSNNNPNVLMHGPTFMGNPLACSVATTSLQILKTYNLSQIKDLFFNQINPYLEEIKLLKNVKAVRILGTIAVVEMHQKVDISLVQKQFIKKGVWIRPFGKLIYIMPPYITTKTELNILGNSLLSVIKENNF